MAAYYSQTVRDRAGNAVTGAAVSVLDPATAAPVPIYADPALTVPLTALTTDYNGAFAFYLPPQRVRIVVTKDGVSRTLGPFDLVDEGALFQAVGAAAAQRAEHEAAFDHTAFQTPNPPNYKAAVITNFGGSATGVTGTAPRNPASDVLFVLTPMFELAAGATLDVNALGPRPIVDANDQTILAGMLRAGVSYALLYTAANTYRALGVVRNARVFDSLSLRTAAGEQLHVAADQSERYAAVLARDAQDFVALGVRRDGSVDVSGLRMRARNSHVYAWALEDADERPILGYRSSQGAWDLVPSRFTLGEIAALTQRNPDTITAAGSVLAPQLYRDGVVRFLSDQDTELGGLRSYLQREGANTSQQELAGPVRITLAYGQSRADNRAEGTGVCLLATRTPRRPYRTLMLNNIRAPGHQFEADFAIGDASDLIALRDCLSTVNPTAPLGQSLGAQCWLLDEDDVAEGRPLTTRVFFAAGEGGQNIATLSKGAAPFVGSGGTFVVYDRLLRMIQQTVLLCAEYGRTCIVDCVNWLQGEQDIIDGTTRAAYKTALLQLIADLRADIPAITGQAEPFEFILDFVSSAGGKAANAGRGGGAQLAQYEIAVENADGHTWGIGPTFWLPYGSASHNTVEGVVLNAERFGRARSGLLRTPPEPPAFIRLGAISLVTNVHTINLEVPMPPLVFEVSTLLPDQPNKGFRLVDGAGAIITGVTLTGPSQITVTYSQPLTSPWRLEHAFTGDGNGPTYEVDQPGGAYSNIRDSSAEPSRFVPGQLLRHFVPTFVLEG